MNRFFFIFCLSALTASGATVYGVGAKGGRFTPASPTIIFTAGGSYNNTVGQRLYTNGASVIPAKTLALLAITGQVSGGAQVTNVTGNGCAWVRIDSTNFNAGAMSISLFRTMTNAATPSGGQVCEFAALQTGCNMYLGLFTNVVTTGTSGSGAIVQSVKGTNATANPSLTLSALATKSGVAMAVSNVDQNGSAGTADEAGFVEDFDNGFNITAQGLYYFHAVNTTDNTPTVTQIAQQWAAIAVEIAVLPP